MSAAEVVNIIIMRTISWSMYMDYSGIHSIPFSSTSVSALYHITDVAIFWLRIAAMAFPNITSLPKSILLCSYDLSAFTPKGITVRSEHSITQQFLHALLKFLYLSPSGLNIQSLNSSCTHYWSSSIYHRPVWTFNHSTVLARTTEVPLFITVRSEHSITQQFLHGLLKFLYLSPSGLNIQSLNSSCTDNWSSSIYHRPVWTFNHPTVLARTTEVPLFITVRSEHSITQQFLHGQLKSLYLSPSGLNIQSPNSSCTDNWSSSIYHRPVWTFNHPTVLARTTEVPLFITVRSEHSITQQFLHGLLKFLYLSPSGLNIQSPNSSCTDYWSSSIYHRPVWTFNHPTVLARTTEVPLFITVRSEHSITQQFLHGQLKFLYLSPSGLNIQSLNSSCMDYWSSSIYHCPVWTFNHPTVLARTTEVPLFITVRSEHSITQQFLHGQLKFLYLSPCGLNIQSPNSSCTHYWSSSIYHRPVWTFNHSTVLARTTEVPLFITVRSEHSITQQFLHGQLKFLYLSLCGLNIQSPNSSCTHYWSSSIYHRPVWTFNHSTVLARTTEVPLFINVRSEHSITQQFLHALLKFLYLSPSGLNIQSLNSSCTDYWSSSIYHRPVWTFNHSTVLARTTEVPLFITVRSEHWITQQFLHGLLKFLYLSPSGLNIQSLNSSCTDYWSSSIYHRPVWTFNHSTVLARTTEVPLFINVRSEHSITQQFLHGLLKFLYLSLSGLNIQSPNSSCMDNWSSSIYHRPVWTFYHPTVLARTTEVPLFITVRSEHSITQQFLHALLKFLYFPLSHKTLLLRYWYHSAFCPVT